jgi:hypothetical protein
MEVLAMHKQAFTFCVTGCRSQLVSWIMLIVLLCSLAPSLSFAQQPTVTITSLSGTVLVNGQTGSPGTILNAGDAIETQANASVVLQFSDGSQMELGESTQLDLAELIETDTGARVSKVKLAWGWLQAHLSAGHQKEGSKFDVETPNALVGVKFSDPKFFINHDLQERATEVKALTVALDVLNRVTGEQIVVPVGSTAIITSLGTQLIAGATSGILSAKTVVIGAGTLALVGGGVALATSGSGGKLHVE